MVEISDQQDAAKKEKSDEELWGEVQSLKKELSQLKNKDTSKSEVKKEDRQNSTQKVSKT